MEIRQLKSFIAVANLSSFSKAAKALHYTQSSISAQIKALEDSLGVQLFDCLEKKITLTEPGLALVDYAKRIVDLSDEMRSEIAGIEGARGSISIRVP